MHNGTAARATALTHNKHPHATPTNNWCSASSYAATCYTASLRFVVCPACLRLSGASNFTQSWSQDFAYQCMSTVGSLCVYFPPSIVSFNVQSPNIVLPQLLRSSILSERGELWVAPTGPARRQTLWSRALEQRPIVNYRTERGTHTRHSGCCWEDFQLIHFSIIDCINAHSIHCGQFS